MVLSYDSRFAFQGQPNHSSFRYADLFSSYYAAVHRCNVGWTLCSRSGPEPLSPGDRPGVTRTEPRGCRCLRQYVQNGGTLLVTARRASKMKPMRWSTCPCQACWPTYVVLSGRVRRAAPRRPRAGDVGGTASAGAAPDARAWLWCDVLAPSTARPVARYQREFYAGRAAVTLTSSVKAKPCTWAQLVTQLCTTW